MRNKLFQSVILIFLITSSAVYAQQAWNRISPVPQENSINDVIVIPGTGQLIAVGEGSTLMTSDNEGETWQISTNPGGTDNFISLAGVCFINGDTGFIHGGYETILKTSDGGNTWGVTYDGGAYYYHQCINDIAFINDSTGFATGYGGLLLKTTDTGDNWAPLETGVNAPFGKIVFFNQENGFILCGGTLVLRTGDGGTTWTPDDLSLSVPGVYIYDACTTSSFNGYIFSNSENPDYNGYISKTTDGGVTWTTVLEDPSAYSGKFAFFDEQLGMIACMTWEYQTKVWLTGDGGITWNVIDHPWLPWWSATGLTYLSQTTAIALGYKGMVHKSTDSGQSWQAQQVRLFSGSVFKVQFTDENTGFVVTDIGSGGVAGKGIKKTTDQGQSWSQIYSNWESSGLDFHFINNNLGYVARPNFMDTLLVSKTTDGGSSWIEYNTGFVLSPLDIRFFDENHGLICSEYRVIKTSDGGTTWTEVTPGTGAFRRIKYRSQQEVYIAGSNDNSLIILFKSSDGGASWESIAAGTGSAASDIALPVGQTIVLTCGTNILKSEDEGQTWQVCQSSNPDLLAFRSLFFVSPMVGYAIGEGYHSTIEKTTDGGNTWFPLNTNTSSALNAAWFFDDDNGFAFGERGLMIETSTGGVTAANILVADENSVLFTISPNPVSGGFILRVRPESNPQGTATLTVTSLTGSLIRQQIINDPVQAAFVSTETLKPGIYLVTIHTKNGTPETHKLVKL